MHAVGRNYQHWPLLGTDGSPIANDVYRLVDGYSLRLGLSPIFLQLQRPAIGYLIDSKLQVFLICILLWPFINHFMLSERQRQESC
jgi:hypothetical protein